MTNRRSFVTSLGAGALAAPVQREHGAALERGACEGAGLVAQVVIDTDRPKEQTQELVLAELAKLLQH